MADEEIGFRELRELVARSWKPIVGLALACGLIAGAVLMVAVPAQYNSSVRLVGQPLLQGSEGGARTTGLYVALLRSDSVLDGTATKLREQGVLAEDEPLIFGEHLAVQTRGQDQEAFVLILNATADDASKAARIANTWAEVFIEESKGMLQSTASSSGELLDRQILPTREQLGGLEARRLGVLDEFREREEKVATTWDQRIASARDKAEREISDFQSATRRQLEEAVERNLAGAGQPVSSALRSQLLEIVSVRAQLAQTPRVLTLEKAASDETLAELIAVGGDADQLDRTLVSQEINPLYDQLTVRVLGLESGLKAINDGADALDLAPILALLEKIQRERAAGLVSLSESKSLEVRTLRRRRGRELEKISEEKTLAVAELRSEIERLRELETRLSARYNQTVMSDLLQKVDLIGMAAPAVPQAQAEPRGLPLKIAVAAFLGGMLGLMIALFRSTGA